MNVEFENDFQQKIMTQSFKEPVTIAKTSDALQWRAAWLKALTSWHSPYKCLVDCTNLTLAQGEQGDEIKKSLDVMIKFFNGFFLRKIVGFGLDEAKGHALLPFPVLSTYEEAAEEIGIRTAKKRDPTDFRATIQLQNHFPTHTVELNFSEPVTISTKEQMAVLKSKLMNNLMQWHSKWILLIDCLNLEIAPEMDPEFDKLWKGLRGFFMKQVIGYAPRGPKDTYPFDVYRARHKAVAFIEGEGNFSGDQADCKSRRKA